MTANVETFAEPWVGHVPTEAWIRLASAQGSQLGQAVRSESLKTSPIVASVAHLICQLLSRHGVAIVRSLPVSDCPEKEVAEIYLALGSALGTLREQSSEGNLLHSVTDKTVFGVSPAKAGGSNSKKRIDLHTENARPPRPPDILSLLCIYSAQSGGESLLLDGYHVHRELARDDAILTLAYAPKAFGRHAEDCAFAGQVDYSPIFQTHAGRTSFRYSRYWLDLAAESAEDGLTGPDRALFDRIDEIVSREEDVAKVLLQPGDTLFVDNRRVMHGRESFEDASESTPRRLLLRTWIDTSDVVDQAAALDPRT